MPSRSLSDFLVWIPAAIYGVSFGIALLSPNRPPLGDLLPVVVFAVLAAAHCAQSSRIHRLEQSPR